MRSILISIKPKWVAKILNGEKTIEIRKTCPEIFKHLKPYEGCSIDVYIYCTKSDYLGYISNRYIGKVVAKFTLNKVEEIKLPYTKFGCSKWVGCEEERTLQTQTMNEETLLEKSCLEKDEIYGYLNFKHSPDNVGYAWCISNLVIFDKPKELNEFIQSKRKNYEEPQVQKAPQSWCYVEALL